MVVQPRCELWSVVVRRRFLCPADRDVTTRGHCSTEAGLSPIPNRAGGNSTYKCGTTDTTRHAPQASSTHSRPTAAYYCSAPGLADNTLAAAGREVPEAQGPELAQPNTVRLTGWPRTLLSHLQPGRAHRRRPRTLGCQPHTLLSAWLSWTEHTRAHAPNRDVGATCTGQKP